MRTQIYVAALRCAAVAALAIVPSQMELRAADVTVFGVVAGRTPETIGYNSAHFMPGSNAAAWWKYSGVNGARVWATPSIVEGNDDNALFGDGVGSQQQFLDRRATLRSDPLNAAYVNWPYFDNRYANNPTSGNIINLKYAFGELHDLGADPVVEIHRTNAAYPFAAAGTPAGWGSRWEQWQHFYAEAFYLAKNFDVRRYQMYNEPNHSSNSISQAEYIERLQLASDAVQSAIADVNSLYGKSLIAQLQGPVTAGGLTLFNANPGGDARDDATGWGEIVMDNLHTNFLGQVDPNFQLIQTYAYQQYNAAGTTFATQLAGIQSLVAQAAGGTPMRTAITEFNVHTAANFDAIPETLDSPSKFSRLGAIFTNLANEQPEELYVFKFSQTVDDSESGVKKNGVHFVDNGNAPYNVGGVTKGGEVVRLFAKGFAGAHELMQLPAASGNFGTSPNLYAKNEPINAAARNVSFIKFDLGAIPIDSVEQAVLRLHGENDGSAAQVIAHVYGIVDDAWDESTITWNNAPNLADTAGPVNDISHNFIEGIGESATVLGHLTGTHTSRELMLDVTSFVREHPDQKLSILIAREVRFDGENVDDDLASLKLASKERGGEFVPQLLLSLNAMALPADFDSNGFVDGDDLTAWQNGFGTLDNATRSMGDANADGDVDGGDYLMWQQSYGTSVAPTSPPVTASVPEPSSLAALVALSPALMRARRQLIH